MFFRKKKLSEIEFAKRFAKQLAEAVIGLEIVSINDLEIRTKFEDSGEFTHFLDNCYSEYSNDPKAIKETIERYVIGAKSLYLPKEPIQLDRILPVIKDHRFISDLKEINPEFEDKHVYEPYNSELFIFYAEDKDHSVNYLTQEELKSVAISREHLKSKAIENLKNIISIESHGDNGYFMLVADGNYESSLILLDIWNGGNFAVNGELVIGIPARDLLLVTGKNDTENIEKLSRFVKDINESGDHLVSKELFEYRNGKFEKL